MATELGTPTYRRVDYDDVDALRPEVADRLDDWAAEGSGRCLNAASSAPSPA